MLSTSTAGRKPVHPSSDQWRQAVGVEGGAGNGSRCDVQEGGWGGPVRWGGRWDPRRAARRSSSAAAARRRAAAGAPPRRQGPRSAAASPRPRTRTGWRPGSTCRRRGWPAWPGPSALAPRSPRPPPPTPAPGQTTTAGSARCQGQTPQVCRTTGDRCPPVITSSEPKQAGGADFARKQQSDLPSAYSAARAARLQ